MVPPSERQSPPLSAGILYWRLLTAATLLPWTAHFLIARWVAPPVWYALVMVYDKLFAPKNGFCMGIPFIMPPGSFMALPGMDLSMLVRWLRS